MTVSTALRQKILDALKAILEDVANGLYHETADDKINEVFIESLQLKLHKNTAEIYCPDDLAVYDADAARTLDTSIIPVRILLTCKSLTTESNNYIYTILQNFRIALWANLTLGLDDDGVAFAHVVNDAPLINVKGDARQLKGKQKVIDGAIIHINVLAREMF